MARKASIISRIGMDWDVNPRSDLTRTAWEEGVTKTLNELSGIKPCTTSRAIIDGIKAATKNVTIVPEQQPLLPGKADANAQAVPLDGRAATRRGGTTEAGEAGAGTGGGSDVRLTFVAQDWVPSSANASLRARDETLLHELVHTLRQLRGIESSTPISGFSEPMRRGEGSVSALMSGQAGKQGPHSQVYNDFEEFVAIVITNIYRSENGRIGLRRDHLGGDAPLAYPMTNPRFFLTAWRAQIDRFCAEMRSVCNKIATVSCAFNPIFERYVEQNRFLPGTRVVRA